VPVEIFPEAIYGINEATSEIYRERPPAERVAQASAQDVRFQSGIALLMRA